MWARSICVCMHLYSCYLFSVHMHRLSITHPVPYHPHTPLLTLSLVNMSTYAHFTPVCLSPCPSMLELINCSVLLLQFMVPSQQLQAAVQTSCLPHIRSSVLLLQVRNSETGSQISGPSSSVEEKGEEGLREGGGKGI